ncbi:thiaminase II [Paenibacillus thermoaerophilus]|uniref:Aminopyrimidine aminohydrolase n=1 Tax=Paenibacillus thermoaerophilus TaxID=1215385 RepID=A0ABW2V085_9BACL
MSRNQTGTADARIGGFSAELRESAKEIWEANHRHPFLKELGAGTLPTDKFIFYLRQDYVYLIDYARMFALGSAKADDVETMAWFARLLEGTLSTEMELHRQYCERFGVSRRELESTEPASVTVSYTSYMLREAYNGTLANVVASVLPCTWSYWEIGRALRDVPGSLDHELYREWIEMYSSDEFGELALYLTGLMNRLAEGLPERELRKLKEQFLTTSRYEYMFWDMAYKKEMWPN